MVLYSDLEILKFDWTQVQVDIGTIVYSTFLSVYPCKIFVHQVPILDAFVMWRLFCKITWMAVGFFLGSRFSAKVPSTNSYLRSILLQKHSFSVIHIVKSFSFTKFVWFCYTSCTSYSLELIFISLLYLPGVLRLLITSTHFTSTHYVLRLLYMVWFHVVECRENLTLMKPRQLYNNSESYCTFGPAE